MPLTDVAFPHGLTIPMKSVKLTRFGNFLFFFIAGVLWYLTDCLLEFKSHPDIPWYETGVFSGPKGFLTTVALFLAAFYVLIFRKDK
jgi:hypothetical protein